MSLVSSRRHTVILDVELSMSDFKTNNGKDGAFQKKHTVDFSELLRPMASLVTS